MNSKYIYLCGPTVYDEVHIGNLRPIITFDFFIKAKRYINNEKIFFIHNITDIDDKIIKKAIEENISELSVAKKYTDSYFNILDIFRITTVDAFPKVTENIPEIINFIDELQKKDIAYKTDSVYFDTSKVSNYGFLSNLKKNDSWNYNDKNKKNEADFVLWKIKKDGLIFDSKFGNGRPGWHTECVTFINSLTNSKPLFIHGGGIDLKFPHHENENAQFFALTGKNITEKWIHIGALNFHGSKMSKSTKNILSTSKYLKLDNSNLNNPDILKLMFLQSSYKSTLDFNNEIFETNKKKLNTFIKIKKYLELERKLNLDIELDDDFNNIIQSFSFLKNSDAFKVINSKIKHFNDTKDSFIGNQIIKIFHILTFNFTFTKIDDKYLHIYDEWKNELKCKNYHKADLLRNELIKKGLI
ncbi:MAG: class I tRNA ligase family protein [Metamycoplasmataceae bacterium]